MLPARASWQVIWDRHRVRILQAGSLILLVFARTSRSNAVFFLGLFIALAGEALRFWAAGHIQHNHELTQHGPYALSRHPLYLGSLMMACGFAVICTSRRHWLATGLVWTALIGTFRFLYAQRIDHEESELERRYGSEFDAYRRHVPRFWPNLGSWEEAFHTAEWSLQRAVKNKEHRTVWALLALALYLRFKMVYF